MTADTATSIFCLPVNVAFMFLQVASYEEGGGVRLPPPLKLQNHTIILLRYCGVFSGLGLLFQTSGTFAAGAETRM
jgi:hypothetical protein